ncbi:acyl-CoA carboxylase subunit epsilon [Nocardioides alcanivorans]|uniref:acyl-CoA carboxylase subunit epsilon n=1 Tax=Nocardioides alcanivorans TaxID=2897352 RepID=UPI001F420A3C|nr:acyl-CoA carboxylase subunit epsilon [Nocardioides alcanivorans]
MSGEKPAEEKVTEAQQPLLQVVNADATPEEIAAIVAVFSALGSGSTEAPKRPARQWAAPRRTHRTPLTHGVGGWRASALPR